VVGIQTLKRIGQPDVVASVIAFLVSDEARWITGDIIALDEARQSVVSRLPLAKLQSTAQSTWKLV
jgi:NAD(P)-dependent dehydrogenase (short-subunit alcohol dehydrogenase family)